LRFQYAFGYGIQTTTPLNTIFKQSITIVTTIVIYNKDEEVGQVLLTNLGFHNPQVQRKYRGKYRNTGNIKKYRGSNLYP